MLQPLGRVVRVLGARAALAQVAFERIVGARILFELLVDESNIVKNSIRRRELVSAPHLEERRIEIAILTELDASLKALLRLVLSGSSRRRRFRALGRALRERRAGAERYDRRNGPSNARS